MALSGLHRLPVAKREHVAAHRFAFQPVQPPDERDRIVREYQLEKPVLRVAQRGMLLRERPQRAVPEDLLAQPLASRTLLGEVSAVFEDRVQPLGRG